MKVGDRVVLAENETKTRLGRRRYGNVIEVGMSKERVRVKWEYIEYTQGGEFVKAKPYTLRTWCAVKRLKIVPTEVL